MGRAPEGFNPAAAELDQQKPTKTQIEWLMKLPVVSVRKAKGSGGQSVNTSSSAAELRWCIADSDKNIFSDEDKIKLVAFFSAKKDRWNNEEQTAIFLRRNERSFEHNKRQLREQLIKEVREALVVVKERNEEIPRSVKAKRARMKDADRVAKMKQKRGLVDAGDLN